MAETEAPAPTDPVPPTPPRRKRRWVRRLLLLAVVVVVGLLLLVALAPTLLSTSPVVSLALKQVNQRLNGRVEVGSVSLGWTTGVRIDGLRVFDDANTQIAQADHVTCPMPLWRAATGKYPLGHTVVDGLAFDAKVDSQGRLNFASLAKSAPTPATPAPTAPSTTPTATAQPSKLPDVSGDLELTNSRGTVSQAGRPTVFLSKLAGTIKIPSINDPIADHLDASMHVGDGGTEGHLVADGTASAIKGNILNLDAANVRQTLDVTGLDLAAAKPFVPASVGLDTLAGLLDGHLSADVTDGKSAVIDASLNGKSIAIGGKALKGDTFSTGALLVMLPKLSAAFPEGLGHWQSGVVKVGVDGGGPIAFRVDQGQFTLVADLPVQALLNLADNRAPGAAGRLEFGDQFDAGKIVAQLKNSAHLSDQATLTSGTLGQSIQLTLTPERATVAVTTNLTGVAGTRNGQPVTIQPIALKIGAADVGGKPLDALRDLSLTLSSKFANADFHGANVGDLAGTLTAQLQSLQAEAGQLVDFGGNKLAGDVAIHVSDSGQLMQAPYAAKVKADVSVTNLAYADATGPRIAEPLVQVNVTGDLTGSGKSAVEAVKNLLLTIKAGTAETPTIDIAAAVPSATLGATPEADFALTRLNVNLSQVQRQFANVPSGQAGPVCDGGILTGTSSGHYGANGIRLDPTKISLASLVVQKQLASGQKVLAINDDTLNVSVAGTVGMTGGTAVKLTDLSIADVTKIVDIHKGDGDFALTKTADAMSGKGTLGVMVDLGSVNDILRLLGQETVTAATPGGRVKTGHLSGTLAFTAAASGRTDIVGNFDVPDLDVASATGTTGPQKASIVLRASSDQSAHTVSADEISFKSPFASAAVTNVGVLLSAKSMVDQLQKASLAIDVPDLKTLMALAQSFSPPPATPPATDKSAPAPTPPLVVTGGSLSVHADVSHDGNNLVIAVPTCAANNVAFTRGNQSYAAKPITAKLAARVGTADGATLMRQLRGLKVTQLDANAGVATVSLTTPITVADLSNPGAGAAGGFKVDGELVDLTRLAAAFGAKPADAYPYRGHLSVTENLTSDATSVALQGSATVAKFQVVQGQTVQFAEDLLSVTNDVAVPPGMTAVGIRNLAVAMQSSKALNVAIANGRVDDLNGARQMKLPVSLHYDLAKLWPIIHPMLLTPGQPDPYADLNITGVFDRPANIAGSYPANVPFTEAVKTLSVDCGLSLASLDHSGLSVRNLDVPITVRNGKLVTVDADGHTAPAAVANDGQLDVGNITVDLTQDPMRVSMPADKVLLTHATINPLFADTFLNKYINNPVFVGTKDATGLLDVTIVKCDRFPAGALAQQAVAANDGTLTVRYSLTDLHVGSAGIGMVLGKVLNNDGGQPDSFVANVKDGTVTLARGVATQNMTFQTGRYAIPFTGDVLLDSKTFRNYSVGLPGAALARLATKDQNILSRLPPSVAVPVRGSLSSPQVDLAGAGVSLVQKAFTDPNTLANIIGGQLNKKGNANGNNAAGNGQQGQSDNPLGDLLNGLGKKKKKGQQNNGN